MTPAEPLLERRPGGAKVSLVIPCLNEERGLRRILPAIPSAVDEIIIVDKQSTDGTIDVATWLCPNVVIIEQSSKGKGGALKEGLAAATGEIIVTMDGDGSMDPLDILDALRVLDEGGFDFVKGSRGLSPGGSADFTRVRHFGNAVLTMLANKLSNASWTDITYGFNAYRRDLIPVAMSLMDGFEFEIQFATRLQNCGYNVGEFASWESPRVGGESKLNSIRDGLRILSVLLAERRRLRADADDGSTGAG